MNDNRSVQVCWKWHHAVPEISDSDDVMRNTSIWPASVVHVIKYALLLFLYINDRIRIFKQLIYVARHDKTCINGIQFIIWLTNCQLYRDYETHGYFVLHVL